MKVVMLCCYATATVSAWMTRSTVQRVPLQRLLVTMTKQTSSSGSSSSKGNNIRDVTKLPRVYLPSQPLKLDSTVLLDPDLGHYLTNVMRLKVGQSFRAFNGIDGEYLCTLEPSSSSTGGTTNGGRKSDRVKAALSSTASVVKLLRSQEDTGATTHAPHVIVYVAALKKPRMKLLLEKVTELGVADIVIVTTQNSESTYDDVESLQSLRAVCVESAEQCERLSVPAMVSNVPLAQVASHWLASLESLELSTIESSARGVSTPGREDRPGSDGQGSQTVRESREGQLLVCRERFIGGESLLQVLLGRHSPQSTSSVDTTAVRSPPSSVGTTVVGLLIGPEGGFTQDELAYLARAQDTFRFVTLGDNVLRAETAAMAAVSTVMACQGIKLPH